MGPASCPGDVYGLYFHLGTFSLCTWLFMHISITGIQTCVKTLLTFPRWGTVYAENKPSPPPIPRENPELSKVFSLKPGVDQNVALRTSSTANNSAFLMSAFPCHSTSFFSILFQHKVKRDMENELDFYLWSDELCFAL